MQWWKDQVLYQIYPKSFYDSNADGIGDLPGITQKLDYLEELGIGGIWLNPIMPSGGVDGGYDVKDYCDIDPVYGGMEAFEELIEKAGEKQIKIIMDIVPNHSSDQHPWFLESRSSKDSPLRDWYVWIDPAPGSDPSTPPNNWKSYFGGPAWSFDEQTEQWYLHNFTPGQPDLNWWNPKVHQAWQEILEFWLKKGVGGFRIDVCQGFYHDLELRDNPPLSENSPLWEKRMGQEFIYNVKRPETLKVFKSWRELADDYGALLYGETCVGPIPAICGYYKAGLHLAYNEHLIDADFEALALAKIVKEMEDLIPEGNLPTWTVSNHDRVRAATRWADGDERKKRLVMAILLTLRGVPLIYYGEELGMEEAEISLEKSFDPIAIQSQNKQKSKQIRDGCRTPMQWSKDGGFSKATPWLPYNDPAGRNVEDQSKDLNSLLSFTKKLIGFRARERELIEAPYQELEVSKEIWSFQRGSLQVVANFSATPKNLPEGKLLVRSSLKNSNQLEAYELVVVRPAPN